MLTLKGQIAVVTGASSGIGKAIALSLINAGAKVCFVGRHLNKLEAIASHNKQFSKQMSIYKADLGIDDDIRSLAASFQKEFGTIDILIHSAGIFSLGNVEEAAIEDFDHQYRINVRAAYLLTQALLPGLKQRCGQVVFINSSVALTAKAGISQYAATKHALKAFADSLREEVNTDGVRVISVYPGRTATPMQETVFKMEKRAYSPEKLMQPEDVALIVINALKLPRTAEVTDISVRPLNKT